MQAPSAGGMYSGSNAFLAARLAAIGVGVFFHSLVKGPVMVATFIFSLSILVSLFWIIGILSEGYFQAEPAPAYIVIPASLLCWLIIAFARQRSRRFLQFQGALDRVILRCAIWTVVTYVVTIPVGLLIGFAYLFLLGRGLPSSWGGDTQQLFIMSALWFPLWWSPAGGIVMAWVRQRTPPAE